MHRPGILRLSVVLTAALCCPTDPAGAMDPVATINVWPGKAPGETKTLPPEADTTRPDGDLVAGRRVIRLGNVSNPQIAVYQPPVGKANGAAVVVCPGGGHYILAMDLEGTEVAEWLTSIGVTAIVLKYRVPARTKERRWTAAVQDAQRTMSLVRSRASEWDIDPQRIGILGFSAGGETAGLTAMFEERQYSPVDAIDKISPRPDFAMLIYPGGFVPRKSPDNPRLQEYIKVTPKTPPMYFVHAFDDPVTVQSSLLLASALRKQNVPTELHIYAKGGHGYGLRPTSEPVTQWPRTAEAWMKRMAITQSSRE